MVNPEQVRREQEDFRECTFQPRLHTLAVGQSDQAGGGGLEV